MAEIMPICTPTDSIADVVFVHGLTGDPQGTWEGPTENGDKIFWPAWICEDIKGVSVWAVKYDSYIIANSMSFVERARNLSHRLKSLGVGSKPIIFVTHSLGGLLTKQILRKSQQKAHLDGGDCPLFDKTEGIVFIATPHSGSGLVKPIGWCCSDIVRYLQSNEGYITDLGDWYRNRSVY